MSTGAAGYYNQLASIYDSATDGRWMPNLMIKPLLSNILTGGQRVLDVGSGTGQSIAGIVEDGLAAEVYAVDVSDQMLEICAGKYPQIVTFLGDIDSFALAFPALTFDLVLCVGAFEFVQCPSLLLSSAASLLKPNGNLLFTFEPIIDFHKLQSQSQSTVVPGDAATQAGFEAHNFLSFRHKFSTILEWLQEADLSVVESREFVAYQKGATDIIYHLVHARKDLCKTFTKTNM